MFVHRHVHRHAEQPHQDLTRLESGGETSFNEPFNLHTIVREATLVYRNEAARRGLDFDVDLSKCPKSVVGDAKKIRTVVANLTANACMYSPASRQRVVTDLLVQ